MYLNSNLASTIRPPVMEARRWLAEIRPETDECLLNLSQAAPVAPPPLELRHEIARFLIDEGESHTYGPVLGEMALREEVADQWSSSYGGSIRPDQVAITSGCNQAFTTAISVLAKAGDSVAITAPWYFNHKMWLDMMGIEAKIIGVNQDMMPDLDTAAALLDDRTRALVLVTPNNPSGCEYPQSLVMDFYALAKSRGIALIIDETYRDFRSSDDMPHGIFADQDWVDTLIHLYSFSKSFRLTGHRVGAVIASSEFLVEAEKYLDTVSICPNRAGQFAALFGLRNLRKWLAGERQEILRRKTAMVRAVSRKPDWKLQGCGAYFAYLGYGYDMSSDVLVRQLLRQTNMLALPDTMFLPADGKIGGPYCRKSIRVAFANIDSTSIDDFASRLDRFTA